MRKGSKATPEQRARMGAPRTRPDVICQACGMAFRPHQRKELTRVGRGDKYCSRSCYYRKKARGEAHPNWISSGRSVVRSLNGSRQYVAVRVNGHWRAEHRVIAERVLGRSLRRNEVVHHINGNGTDNRNSNLLICTQAYHAALHSRMADAWMREHMKAS